MIRVVNRIARPWESSFLAVQAAAETAGFTRPGYDYALRLNGVIRALKLANQWDEMDIFYAFSHDGSLDYKRYNYKSPGNFSLVNLTTDPTHTVNGLGATAVSTQWIPSTHAVKYTRNDAAFGCYIRTGWNQGGPTGAVTGMTDGTTNNWLATGNTQNVRGRINGNTTNVASAAVDFSSDSSYMMKRTSSTNCELFRNGISIAGPSSIASQPLNTVAAYVSAINASGVTSLAITDTGYRMGFLYYGSSVLDDAVLKPIFAQYYA